jgi:hypothetical protein
MAPNPFLKKKWEKVFYQYFDLDKNQSVDWNDFEVFFDRIKKDRGEDSVEYRFARDSMTMAWKGLLAICKGFDIADDVPKDACIVAADWDAMWEKTDTKAHMPMWQWEYVKFMFLLLDSSGDKYIDDGEYASVVSLFGISEADAKAAFAKFAVHHKTGAKLDKIDYSLFVVRWIEYFTSEDEKAPGNALFGPL